VGMGMPRQEHWIMDNLHRLHSMVVLPCGASIDYVCGEIPTPPRWAGRWGLEWLCRLLAEPRRLWKRYLIEPWFLGQLFLVHWVRAKLYS
jgi:N-acetylglucosaminyldiphosphoundecaprenol N-acetyl-beta-D-mannosaminyltransferase